MLNEQTMTKLYAMKLNGMADGYEQQRQQPKMADLSFVMPGDQINVVDPMLGALKDNGGPTFTHALLPGSPAFDAGDPSFVGPPVFDQRDTEYERIHGGAIDIGAYEAQTPPMEADLNLDGFVDALDFGILASNFGPTSGGYADGNLNGDAFIDAADIGIMFGAWTGDVGPAATIVPEPSTLLLASLAGCALLHRRRRR